MMYFIIQSIRHYFQYPTQTSVSIVMDQQAAFPAVTICNYSPLRSDLVLPSFMNYTNARNVTNITDLTKLTRKELEMLEDFMIEKANRAESMREYFFSLAVMFLGCDYNGITCTTSDFRSFISSKFGLCYTFNAKARDTNASQVRSITDKTRTGKLLLHLYAHSHLYISSFSNGQSTVTMFASETSHSCI